jgi:glycosyltransferase involved in cell wall biosynthesis
MGLGAVVKAYEVLMATCNGERFLDQQMASILGQTVLPERLLVADDHSSDQTLQRLQHWCGCSPVPIALLPPSGSERLGSCRNFERLLQASSAPYVMLADQDDLWDLDKAERLLGQMALLEQRWGSEQPLLVYADLRLIDAEGQALGPSFHRLQGLQPTRQALLDIGLQNVVTGCASILNRACVRQALPFPAEAVLHDWWLALVAAQATGLVYLREVCVSYRQHRSNVVGAAGWLRQLLRRMKAVFSQNPRAVLVGLISPGLQQLRACLARYGPADLAERCQLLWSPSRWMRLCAAVRLGLRKHGLWRTAGFYAALFCCRPSGY